jgi:hypothetical protein
MFRIAIGLRTRVICRSMGWLLYGQIIPSNLTRVIHLINTFREVYQFARFIERRHSETTVR